VFELWAEHIGDGDIILKMRHKMALVKDWELTCPELEYVSFIDGSALERRGNIWSRERYHD
jgi:hypothetical protein